MNLEKKVNLWRGNQEFYHKFIYIPPSSALILFFYFFFLNFFSVSLFLSPP